MVEWDKEQLEWIVETAILSSATIKLDITSSSQEQGSGPAHTVALVPSNMTGVSKQIRHLALYISEPFRDTHIADGGKYLRATTGMASLGQQLPDLKSLTLYLDIHTSGMNEGLARSGIWWATQCTDGSLVPLGSAPPLTGKDLETLVNELLVAVKEHGPGKTKLFKLSIEHDPSQRDVRFSDGHAPSTSYRERWMWKLICDDVDLSVEHALSYFTQQAWDSRKQEPLD